MFVTRLPLVINSMAHISPWKPSHRSLAARAIATRWQQMAKKDAAGTDRRLSANHCKSKTERVNIVQKKCIPGINNTLGVQMDCTAPVHSGACKNMLSISVHTSTC